MDYKGLTVEQIEEAFKELCDKNKDDFFVKEISPGWYRLPGGINTNRAGLEMIDKAMRKAGEEALAKMNIKPKTKIRRQSKSKYIP